MTVVSHSGGGGDEQPAATRNAREVSLGLAGVALMTKSVLSTLHL